jgi:hypothetical protein
MASNKPDGDIARGGREDPERANLAVDNAKERLALLCCGGRRKKPPIFAEGFSLRCCVYFTIA